MRPDPDVDVDVDVAVVGAGPTGLALALQAQAHGATVRVLERRADATRPSKALIVQPRTLEVLRPLGVADALVQRGDATPAAHLHLRGRRIEARVDHLDLRGTPFPHLLLIAQAEVERVLDAALQERGVVVERGVEVRAIDLSSPDRASVDIADGGRCTARFVVGCDGAGSVTRSALGASWDGGAHAEQVVLADVDLDGDLDPDHLQAAPGPWGLVFLFALGERARWRLLATRPAPPGPVPAHGVLGEPVDTNELDRLLGQAGIPARVRACPWSASVSLEHRLASTYRSAHGFVAGDAAHAHSPAGGLGMNTGLQDAANLGWKLAFAARTRCPADALLWSYEHERRAAARRVVALTRAIFWAEASTGPAGRAVRRAVGGLGPALLPFVLRRRRLLGLGVGTLGQMNLRHPRSPLTAPPVRRCRGLPRPGDRVRDGPAHGPDGPTTIHGLVARPGVHLLVQGGGHWDPPVRSPWLAVHRIGGQGSHLVAVRPDGIVGYVGERSDPAALVRWLDLACLPRG